MKDDKAIKKMKAFTRRGCCSSICNLAFSCSHAYATDGRIGVEFTLNAPHADEIPGNYPIDSLKKILDGPHAEKNWFTIKFAEFELLEKHFKDAYEAERAEYLCAGRSRYSEETCPCCNRTVYWDSFGEKLVDKRRKWMILTCATS